mmetsp:Transcript_11493/g.43132  ORF Transcript_11493/g.43132 Transcript_11493/m.43132 type:complete len:291 (-) Transcript_11493:835-1707(-)
MSVVHLVVALVSMAGEGFCMGLSVANPTYHQRRNRSTLHFFLLKIFVMCHLEKVLLRGVVYSLTHSHSTTHTGRCSTQSEAHAYVSQLVHLILILGIPPEIAQNFRRGWNSLAGFCAKHEVSGVIQRSTNDCTHSGSEEGNCKFGECFLFLVHSCLQYTIYESIPLLLLRLMNIRIEEALIVLQSALASMFHNGVNSSKYRVTDHCGTLTSQEGRYATFAVHVCNCSKKSLFCAPRVIFDGIDGVESHSIHSTSHIPTQKTDPHVILLHLSLLCKKNNLLIKPLLEWKKH